MRTSIERHEDIVSCMQEFAVIYDLLRLWARRLWDLKLLLSWMNRRVCRDLWPCVICHWLLQLCFATRTCLTHDVCDCVEPLEPEILCGNSLGTCASPIWAIWTSVQLYALLWSLTFAGFIPILDFFASILSEELSQGEVWVTHEKWGAGFGLASHVMSQVTWCRRQSQVTWCSREPLWPHKCFLIVIFHLVSRCKNSILC